MSILVTGGAGFIGSHVTDFLIKNGYDVVIVDNLSSGKNRNINSKAKFYNLDIISDKLEKIFKENNIEYVFHFAAQASVSSSIKSPVNDAKENILGTVNLLNLCKKYKIKKIIYASTAAVYGIPEYLPVDENHSTNCLSFYGLSKLTAEKYIQLFGLDYIIFRFANVYGARQSCEGEAGVVAIFADKMKNNQKIQIHGDGTQTRDFVHVTDIAQICFEALNPKIKNEIINVSTNKAVSVNKLFELMAQKYGYSILPEHTQERQGDIKHSVLDNKKCLKTFNIIPKTTLQKGLSSLII
ncbi:MAG TPA: NAD-dependent epimerase/dehydratase family protein [Candidatus Gastranaerophilaceae bacterium]|mgnify:CR=1 FL=1|nr:NAD-dependent epimerase/dehydratase family protein [Candidatus Gastranaerophilaceae bacterium]